MESILLDNWSIEEFISYNFDPNGEKFNKKYFELLEAIVLWDNLYYPNNSYSMWWKNVGQNHIINKVIKPLYDDGREQKKEAEEILKDIRGKYQFTDNVGLGGIRYTLLSNKHGLNYFPCKKRSVFLSQIGLYSSNSFINRYNIMGMLDNEIKKYYVELNEFFGKNVFDFEFPILVDYILQNTPSNMTPIEYAIELRKDKQVVSYRKYLKEIELAFNTGQWYKIFDFKDATKQLVRDIYQEKSLVDSITINLLALPSFNISMKGIYKRNIHLSFLRKLGKFSYSARKSGRLL